MDRLKVLEGESEAFSFFKTQEDEEEKAKKKKDCFISPITTNDSFVRASPQTVRQVIYPWCHKNES